MRTHRSLTIACLISSSLIILPGVQAADAYPGIKSEWHGFKLYEYEHTKIVVPETVAHGKPWVWRARFFDLKPGFDIAMLNQGYHVVYCDVTDLFGSPKAVARWDEFYDTLRNEFGFAEKAIVSGMSRGGLIMYNWAIANPDKVAALYGDAPVMDFKSWPGWWDKRVLQSYGFKSHEEALAYEGNPLDNLEPLAKANIPIIHVVGDLDDIVPVAENTGPAEKKYKALGGTFVVIHKPDAKHDHGLADPTPLVNFVLRHDKHE
jgi:pimeloyl-ACP methyl ester carboxylesterase